MLEQFLKDAASVITIKTNTPHVVRIESSDIDALNAFDKLAREQGATVHPMRRGFPAIHRALGSVIVEARFDTVIFSGPGYALEVREG